MMNDPSPPTWQRKSLVASGVEGAHPGRQQSRYGSARAAEDMGERFASLANTASIEKHTNNGKGMQMKVQETGSSTAGSVDAADYVVQNGKIYTSNEKQPWAEAIAIKRGEHCLRGR